MKIFRVMFMTAAIILGSLVATHPKVAEASVVPHPAANVYVYKNLTTPETDVSIVYIVKNGNTLTSIAQTQKMSWKDIYCANKKVIGTNYNLIRPGQHLVIKVSNCKLPVVHKTDETTAKQTDYVSSGNSSNSNNNSNAGSQTPPPQVSGNAQQIALELLHGNTVEFACLNNIIEGESGWSVTATNPSSGAYGIPQALPGSKMAVAGSDWQYSAYTQLLWMIDDYVNPVYGSACNAWAFHLAHGWY